MLLLHPGISAQKVLSHLESQETKVQKVGKAQEQPWKEVFNIEQQKFFSVA